MSCYYDLECLDCPLTEGEYPRRPSAGYCNTNRGQKELLVLLKLRPALEALALAHEQLRKEPDWYGLPPFVGWDSGPLLDAVPRAAHFFAEHLGCIVVVKSEYANDAFFGCQKYVDEEYKRETGPRENTRECRLDFNHEGPCSRTRSDGK